MRATDPFTEYLPHNLQHQQQTKQVIPIGSHISEHTLQEDSAEASRRASIPHHHARAAAHFARNQPPFTTVTITDPKNPSKFTVLPRKILYKDESDQAPQMNQSWTTLDIGGMGIRTIAPAVYSYTFLTTLYVCHNNLSKLTPAMKTLVNLQTLDISSNKLTSIPSEIGLLASLRKLLLFDNELRRLPYELGTLYQLELLGLKGNPIDDQEVIDLLYNQNYGTKGVIAYLRENTRPGQPPPRREIIQVEVDDIDVSHNGKNSSVEEKFTVLCYNILCQKYATEKAYGYTPTWALNQEYRKEQIINEILHHDADIVCLQEVEMNQYEDYFEAKMKKDGGYESLFFPKSRAKTMNEEEQRAVDGCATFYKAEKFKCINNSLLEFNQKAVQSKQVFDNSENIYNRVMTKDNIAIMMMLETRPRSPPQSPAIKPTPTRLLVANPHIHWDPSFADVKLVQVGMLMDELEQFAKATVAMHGLHTSSVSDIPTIICGDFNSEPTSGVYEFLSKGVVEQGHRDFGNHMYGRYTSDGLTHKLSLKSAYSHIGELPYTNYTPRFKGALDYIWFTNNTMDLINILGPIDADYMSQVVGFPNVHFPSDHIPIMSELRFRPLRREKLPEPNFGSPAVKTRR